MVGEGFWNPWGGEQRAERRGLQREKQAGGSWPWPLGTCSFQDSGCLTSRFLAETLSHVRHWAGGSHRDKEHSCRGTEVPRGEAFLPPQK